MSALPTRFEDVEALEDFMSEPTPGLMADLARVDGDLMVIGVGGKMGPTLARMAKRAGLPWDVILGAEPARAYKPTPQAYQRNAEMLNLEPKEVMLVAAHNGDLAAAAKVGLRTAFVYRKDEYGPRKPSDKADGHSWDITVDSFNGVADAMGCARLK